MSLCAPEIDEETRSSTDYLDELRTQECPRITPESTRRERGLLIDWLLLDNEISLIPCTIDKTPKMPCLQKKLDPANYQGKKHPSCEKFGHGFKTATRDRELLLDVLDLHPEMVLGVVPGPDRLILDMDSDDAIASFLAATGADVEENPWVSTERGAHLHVKWPGAKSFKTKQLPNVDIRKGGVGFVIAPGCERSERALYTHTRGIWGHVVENEAVVRYILKTVARRPKTSGVQRKQHVKACGAEKILLEKWRNNFDLMYGQLKDTPAGREYRSRRTKPSSRTDDQDAYDLCSVWNVAYHLGFTQEQALGLVKKFQPKLAQKRLESRDEVWLVEDVARVYTSAAGWTGNPLVRYQAEQALQTIERLCGKESRQYLLLDWIVRMCTTTQKDVLNVGQEATAELFDVTHVTIGRDLRFLRQTMVEGLVDEDGQPVPVLRVVRRHWYDAKRWKHCRTTSYAVGGMVAVGADGKECPDLEKAAVLQAEKALLTKVNDATGQCWPLVQMDYEVDLVGGTVDVRIFDERLQTSDPVVQFEIVPNREALSPLVRRAEANCPNFSSPENESNRYPDVRKEPNAQVPAKRLETLVEKVTVNAATLGRQRSRYERIFDGVKFELDDECLPMNRQVPECIDSACLIRSWDDVDVVQVVTNIAIGWDEIRRKALTMRNSPEAEAAIRAVEGETWKLLFEAEERLGKRYDCLRRAAERNVIRAIRHL